MAAVEFDIDVSKLKDRIQEAKDRIPQEISKELWKFGNEVMGDSKRVVPVDTGALMNTGKVTLPVNDGQEISITLGYGDESAKYALYVHENMDPNVNWSRPGSGPKYLEQPLKNKQNQLPGRIKQAVTRAVKGR